MMEGAEALTLNRIELAILQNYLTRNIVIMTQFLIGTARIAIDCLLLHAAVGCQSVLSAHSIVSRFTIIRLLSAAMQSSSLLPSIVVYDLVRFALNLQMQSEYLVLQ